MAKKKSAKKKAVKKPAGAPKKVAKKAPAKNKVANKKAPKGGAKIVDSPVRKQPANMSSNEALVGKGRRDEAVPAIAKGVKRKVVKAGKAKDVVVPVRTGAAGGRPGGGGTGELAPVRDAAAGRGHGQRRTKR